MPPFTPNIFILFFLVASAQSSTHYRYPVLHEVRWGADLQSIITRKLINETHGNNIFILSCCYLGITQKEFSSLLVLIQRCNRPQSLCSTKAVLQGKLKGAQCSEPVKSRVPSIIMICMKNLTFSSRPRAKVGSWGPPGSARAQPWALQAEFRNVCVKWCFIIIRSHRANTFCPASVVSLSTLLVSVIIIITETKAQGH